MWHGILQPSDTFVFLPLFSVLLQSPVGHRFLVSLADDFLAMGKGQKGGRRESILIFLGLAVGYGFVVTVLWTLAEVEELILGCFHSFILEIQGSEVAHLLQGFLRGPQSSVTSLLHLSV